MDSGSGMSPSAPQMGGWSSDEKSRMNPSDPPPYQDTPYTGYQNPPQGPGFQPQYGGGPYGQQTYPVGPEQQYPQQPGVIGVQPVVYVTQRPLGEPVNDYLGYSIFTMLCCCLPLGIAALIYSISTRDANSVGDQEKAERCSKTAKTLNNVALGIGIGVLVLYIIMAIVMTSMH
ncbi:proline-rich transmembrane protein 1-like isoform X2 [Thalassophryne amazonica]|uniref:proline-rich transmembrane protein 1-like isoform X2 n=1 Tax=Thalassophryne amazonica TaxID=390379 RepID=UPI00147252A6|nr:proline-rich transmembrane protein 1-like isoform X2 [Thalassophryne amazonica]